MKLTLPEITGQGGGQFSGRIKSVSYVETTVGQLSALLDPTILQTFPPTARAWMFVAYGRFQQHSKGETGPAMSTAVSVVVAGYPAPAWSELEHRSYELSRLGAEIVIQRGAVAEIDRIREPTDPTNPTILVATPSLVAGKVQVPVSSTGSGFAPYSGFSVHVRWSSSVFSFSSANSTGGVIASPVCPSAILDSDGSGVTYACAATGGPTSTTGLLATIVLTPGASGCSPLHLFTFGAPDGGVASNGTYTIDADANTPQTVAYADGSANVSGQVC